MGADRASIRQCVAGGGTAKLLFALAGCTGVGWAKPEPEAGVVVGAGTTKPEPATGPELDAAVVVGAGGAALCATRLFA